MRPARRSWPRFAPTSAHPEGIRALWYMGVHDYWRDVRDCVDLFVPEIYLNYGGNHLGKIDAYVRRTRQVGCMDRMIPGLGINVVEDKDKHPTVVPTQEDVLRQIRHLKTIAPELNGVGFFTSDSAAPGVAEYADELCRTYYLNPVLTLVPDSLEARISGRSLKLSATLRNCGGMTARDVRVQFGSGYGSDFQSAVEQAIPALAAGREAGVTATLAPQPGVHCCAVRLASPRGIATLQDSLWTTVAKGVPEDTSVVVQPPTDTPEAGLPLFVDVPMEAHFNAACGLDENGRMTARVPAALLPGLPGDAGAVATWVPRSLPLGQPAAFGLTAGRGSGGEATPERNGNLLGINMADYTSILDLVNDQITSLKQRADGPDLIGSAWRFTSTGCAGAQAAQVTPLSGGLLVTIPFTNPQAEGFMHFPHLAGRSCCLG